MIVIALRDCHVQPMLLCYRSRGVGQAVSGMKRCLEKGDTDVADDEQAIALIPSY